MSIIINMFVHFGHCCRDVSSSSRNNNNNNYNRVTRDVRHQHSENI